MDSEEIYKQAILFRRWLHRHPEVSTQEFQTQAFVIDVLKEYKIPYKTYERKSVVWKTDTFSTRRGRK